MIDMVISGGQTGVDRAALDAAIRLGIPHSGWCPRGRRAEDGRIATDYRLRETKQSDYSVRTEWNVHESDATLILHESELEGGTALTLQYARQHDKPHLVVDLELPLTADAIHDWLAKHGIKRLNIAGPRESKRPGIYKRAHAYLIDILGGN